MDIGPIAGIRVMPLMKFAPAEQKLPVVFDIEALAHPVDDTWADDSSQAAGGQDDEPDAINPADEASADEAGLSEDPRRVDFFA